MKGFSVFLGVFLYVAFIQSARGDFYYADDVDEEYYEEEVNHPGSPHDQPRATNRKSEGSKSRRPIKYDRDKEKTKENQDNEKDANFYSDDDHNNAQKISYKGKPRAKSSKRGSALKKAHASKEKELSRELLSNKHTKRVHHKISSSLRSNDGRVKAFDFELNTEKTAISSKKPIRYRQQQPIRKRKYHPGKQQSRVSLPNHNSNGNQQQSGQILELEANEFGGQPRRKEKIQTPRQRAHVAKQPAGQKTKKQPIQSDRKRPGKTGKKQIGPTRKKSLGRLEKKRPGQRNSTLKRQPGQQQYATTQQYTDQKHDLKQNSARKHHPESTETKHSHQIQKPFSGQKQTPTQKPHPGQAQHASQRKNQKSATSKHIPKSTGKRHPYHTQKPLSGKKPNSTQKPLSSQTHHAIPNQYSSKHQKSALKHHPTSKHCPKSTENRRPHQTKIPLSEKNINPAQKPKSVKTQHGSQKQHPSQHQKSALKHHLASKNYQKSTGNRRPHQTKNQLSGIKQMGTQKPISGQAQNAAQKKYLNNALKQHPASKHYPKSTESRRPHQTKMPHSSKKLSPTPKPHRGQTQNAAQKNPGSQIQKSALMQYPENKNKPKSPTYQPFQTKKPQSGITLSTSHKPHSGQHQKGLQHPPNRQHYATSTTTRHPYQTTKAHSNQKQQTGQKSHGALKHHLARKYYPKNAETKQSPQKYHLVQKQTSDSRQFSEQCNVKSKNNKNGKPKPRTPGHRGNSDNKGREKSNSRRYHIAKPKNRGNLARHNDYYTTPRNRGQAVNKSHVNGTALSQPKNGIGRKIGIAKKTQDQTLNGKPINPTDTLKYIYLNETGKIQEEKLKDPDHVNGTLQHSSVTLQSAEIPTSNVKAKQSFKPNVKSDGNYVKTHSNESPPKAEKNLSIKGDNEQNEKATDTRKESGSAEAFVKSNQHIDDRTKNNKNEKLKPDFSKLVAKGVPDDKAKLKNLKKLNDKDNNQSSKFEDLEIAKYSDGKPYKQANKPQSGKEDVSNEKLDKPEITKVDQQANKDHRKKDKVNIDKLDQLAEKSKQQEKPMNHKFGKPDNITNSKVLNKKKESESLKVDQQTHKDLINKQEAHQGQLDKPEEPTNLKVDQQQKKVTVDSSKEEIVMLNQPSELSKLKEQKDKLDEPAKTINLKVDQQFNNDTRGKEEKINNKLVKQSENSNPKLDPTVIKDSSIKAESNQDMIDKSAESSNRKVDKQPVKVPSLKEEVNKDNLDKLVDISSPKQNQQPNQDMVKKQEPKHAKSSKATVPTSLNLDQQPNKVLVDSSTKEKDILEKPVETTNPKEYKTITNNPNNQEIEENKEKLVKLMETTKPKEDQHTTEASSHKIKLEKGIDKSAGTANPRVDQIVTKGPSKKDEANQGEFVDPANKNPNKKDVLEKDNLARLTLKPVETTNPNVDQTVAKDPSKKEKAKQDKSDKPDIRSKNQPPITGSSKNEATLHDKFKISHVIPYPKLDQLISKDSSQINSTGNKELGKIKVPQDKLDKTAIPKISQQENKELSKKEKLDTPIERANIKIDQPATEASKNQDNIQQGKTDKPAKISNPPKIQQNGKQTNPGKLEGSLQYKVEIAPKEKSKIGNVKGYLDKPTEATKTKTDLPANNEQTIKEEVKPEKFDKPSETFTVSVDQQLNNTPVDLNTQEKVIKDKLTKPVETSTLNQTVSSDLSSKRDKFGMPAKPANPKVDQEANNDAEKRNEEETSILVKPLKSTNPKKDHHVTKASSNKDNVQQSNTYKPEISEDQRNVKFKQIKPEKFEGVINGKVDPKTGEYRKNVNLNPDHINKTAEGTITKADQPANKEPSKKNEEQQFKLRLPEETMNPKVKQLVKTDKIDKSAETNNTENSKKGDINQDEINKLGKTTYTKGNQVPNKREEHEKLDNLGETKNPKLDPNKTSINKEEARLDKLDKLTSPFNTTKIDLPPNKGSRNISEAIQGELDEQSETNLKLNQQTNEDSRKKEENEKDKSVKPLVIADATKHEVNQQSNRDPSKKENSGNKNRIDKLHKLLNTQRSGESNKDIKELDIKENEDEKSKNHDSYESPTSGLFQIIY